MVTRTSETLPVRNPAGNLRSACLGGLPGPAPWLRRGTRALAKSLLVIAFASPFFSGIADAQCAYFLENSRDLLCRSPVQSIIRVGPEYYVDFIKNPQAAGTTGATLDPGSCAWVDRPLNILEPRVLLSSAVNAQGVVSPVWDLVNTCLSSPFADCVLGVCARNDENQVLEFSDQVAQTLYP